MAATKTKTLTVASGGTTSNTADLGIVDGNQEIVGFIIATTLVSTTMTFNVSDDDVTYQQLVTQAGSALSITVASNKNIGLSQDVRAQIGRWRFIQAVMGSTETNGATIKVLVK